MPFSSLPSGWTEFSLAEVAEVHDSKRVPLNATERASRKGPYPYYGANGQVDSIDSFLFDGDYVLVAEDGGYFDDPSRKVAYTVSGRFWANNHAHVLKPKNGFDLRFLMHHLNTVPWMDYVSGTTRLKLTQAALLRVRVSAPPLDEQRRIVARIEEMMERSQAAKGALENAHGECQTFHESSLLDCVTAGNLLKAPKDLLASGSPHELPRGWSLTRLGELLIEGPKNGYSPASKPDAAGTLTLRLSATTSRRIILNELTTKRIDEVVAADSPLWLRPGDLLVQRSNTIDYVGTAVVFDGPEKTYIYPDLMSRLRFGDSAVAEWIACLLNSHLGREWVRSVATGTAGNMPKINGASLRQMWVPVPPRDIIASRVQRVRDSKTRMDSIYKVIQQLVLSLSDFEESVLRNAFAGLL